MNQLLIDLLFSYSSSSTGHQQANKVGVSAEDIYLQARYSKLQKQAAKKVSLLSKGLPLSLQFFILTFLLSIFTGNRSFQGNHSSHNRLHRKSQKYSLN